jgi:hypothetical protein
MMGVPVAGVVVTPLTLLQYVRNNTASSNKVHTEAFATIQLDGAFVRSSVDELPQAIRPDLRFGAQDHLLPCLSQGMVQTN